MAVVVFVDSYYCHCLLIVGLFASLAFANEGSYPPKIGGYKCDDSEQWVQCPGCQATCDDPFPQSYSCPRICYKNGICVCKRGLVRSSDGNCIKLDECPHPECGRDEKWTPCNAYCEKTCVNLNQNNTCDELPQPPRLDHSIIHLLNFSANDRANARVPTDWSEDWMEKSASKRHSAKNAVRTSFSPSIPFRNSASLRARNRDTYLVVVPFRTKRLIAAACTAMSARPIAHASCWRNVRNRWAASLQRHAHPSLPRSNCVPVASRVVPRICRLFARQKG